MRRGEDEEVGDGEWRRRGEGFKRPLLVGREWTEDGLVVVVGERSRRLWLGVGVDLCRSCLTLDEVLEA